MRLSPVFLQRNRGHTSGRLPNPMPKILFQAHTWYILKLSGRASRRILTVAVTLSTTTVETNEDMKESKLNLFPIQLTVRDPFREP